MGTVVDCGANWTKNLAEAIKNSEDGDVLVVNTDAKRQLAEGAKSRMGKSITIEVGSE